MPINPLSAKDRKTIKDNLVFMPSTTATCVIVLAMHPEKDLNRTTQIPCDKGVPIGGMAYDLVRDCYWLECFDFLDLGTISASVKLGVVGSPFWQMPIPLPVDVIKKYMSKHQQEQISEFMDKYPDCQFNFLQLLDCND